MAGVVSLLKRELGVIMKKQALDFSKCKTALGRGLEYDLMLLSEKDIPVVSIFVNKDIGLNKEQKKRILKKLRKSLDFFIQECKSEDSKRTIDTTKHISLYEDDNYEPFQDPEYERTYFDT